MRLRIRKLAATALFLLGGIVATALTAQEPTAEDLDRLRADIARLERDLERQISRRDDGMSELRTIEMALAGTRTELATIAAAIVAQSERRDEIAAERRQAAASLAEEQSSLAEQVRMSYRSGHQELIKLLLSQENPADFGRMLVYYNYLNAHRSERIAVVDSQLARIEVLAIESERVARDLEDLKVAQQGKAEQLNSQRAERAALVAELDRSIDSSAAEIERLRAEEAQLNQALIRLAELLEDFPVSNGAPFAEQKGKLAWPVEGPHTVGFGDPRTRDGRVRWSGEIIAAEVGTRVRAVYHGRVALAQWMSGYGLVLMIDHGEGYVSLYGHNSVLLKQPGDWVEPGEPIAEAGDSGGQTGSGVYFGITKDAEFIDPGDWVR